MRTAGSDKNGSGSYQSAARRVKTEELQESEEQHADDGPGGT